MIVLSSFILYVWICVWCVSVVCVHLCEDQNNPSQSPLLPLSYLTPIKQCLSLNLKLNLWPENPNNLSASDPQSAGITSTCTAFYAGTGDLNSDPHACSATTLIHWAILPGTMFLYFYSSLKPMILQMKVKGPFYRYPNTTRKKKKKSWDITKIWKVILGLLRWLSR